MSFSIMLLPVIFAVLAVIIAVAVVVIVQLSRKKHNNIYSGTMPIQQMPIQPAAPQQNGLQFCPQCGSNLQPDSIFCNNCGYKVK